MINWTSPALNQKQKCVNGVLIIRFTESRMCLGLILPTPAACDDMKMLKQVDANVFPLLIPNTIYLTGCCPAKAR